MCLAVILVRYELLISERELLYKTTIVNVTLYTKHLYPQQIQQIKYKRYGWVTPGATNIKQASFFKFCNFELKEVLYHLDRFAKLTAYRVNERFCKNQ